MYLIRLSSSLTRWKAVQFPLNFQDNPQINEHISSLLLKTPREYQAKRDQKHRKVYCKFLVTLRATGLPHGPG